MKIPILDLKPAVQELRGELDAACRRVMDSGWFLLGPELEAFESEYARAVGVRHCVGVANGLEALQLVLMAIGISPGDEVIVPAHGYIATWLAVTHAGATPIPVECDERTYNLDPGRVAAAITGKTRAILPIHLYGQTADMEAINALARERGLFVLEDGAQAHGAKCRGRQSGALGGAAGISFYPSKNLGALADGGAVTTDDAALADRLRHLRNYGSKVRYQNEMIGLNSRLEELQAAFLRVKLPRLDEWNARRRELAKRYLSLLAGVPDVILPHVPDWAEPVWHQFVIRVPRRTELQAFLEKRGIGTAIHYPTPPHLQPAYANGGRAPQATPLHNRYSRGSFPIAERLAGEVLSLPIGPHHTAAQVEEVAAGIREYFALATGAG